MPEAEQSVWFSRRIWGVRRQPPGLDFELMAAHSQGSGPDSQPPDAKSEEAAASSELPGGIESALARRIAGAKVRRRREAYANTLPIPIVPDPLEEDETDAGVANAETLVDIQLDPDDLK